MAPTERGGQFARQFFLPQELVEKGFTYLERLPIRGSEASLHLLKDSADEVVVLKLYHSNAPKREALDRIQTISSEHVSCLLAYGDSEMGFWEVQEWVQGGSLRNLMQNEGPQVPPAVVEEVLKEVVLALKDVHKQGIEHRDLKPENILIRSRHPLDIVLIDFGIASVVEGSVRHTSASRTTLYAPPEAFSGIFRKSCWDYWSLGMILVELLDGQHPLASLPEQVVMNRLTVRNPDEFAAGVSDPRWKPLCRGLLRRDPEKRWGAAQIERWLNNDRSLVVQEDAASGYERAPSPPFLGERAQTPEELAAKLASNWKEAVPFWQTNAKVIKNWVLHDLGRKDISERLDAIDLENIKVDGELFRAIRAMAPSMPATFRGMLIDVSGLTKIVKRALANDDDALATVTLLHENRILAAVDRRHGPPEFTPIDLAWRREIANYEGAASQIAGRLRDRNAVQLTKEKMATLLGAVLPGTDLLDRLRQHAREATSEDARECPWFRSLADAHGGGAGALLVMPLVAGIADHETKERHAREAEQRRQEEEQRQLEAKWRREERNAKLLKFLGPAAYLSVIVLVAYSSGKGGSVFGAGLGIGVLGAICGGFFIERGAAGPVGIGSAILAWVVAGYAWYSSPEYAAQQKETVRREQVEQQRRETERAAQRERAEQEREEAQRQRREADEARRRADEERRQLWQVEQQRQAQARRMQYLQQVRCGDFSDVGRVCCPIGQRPDNIRTGNWSQPWKYVCVPAE